jgi:hypothetical protein
MDILPNEIIIHILQYISPYILNININVFDILDETKTEYDGMMHNPAFDYLYNTCKTLTNFMVNKRFTDIIVRYGLPVIYFHKSIDTHAIKKYKSRYILAPNDDLSNDYTLYTIHDMKIDIQMLYLRFNTLVTGDGLKYIPNVKYLNLFLNKNIVDKHLSYIPHVKYLNLYWNKDISNKGLAYIKEITHLIIPWNKKITIYGLRKVPKLKYLNLYTNTHIILDCTSIYFDFVPVTHYLPQIKHIECNYEVYSIKDIKNI